MKPIYFKPAWGSSLAHVPVILRNVVCVFHISFSPQSREIDHNRDGRVDVFNFTLEFTLDQNQVVSGIRLLTFFDVQLHVSEKT